MVPEVSLVTWHFLFFAITGAYVFCGYAIDSSQLPLGVRLAIGSPMAALLGLSFLWLDRRRAVIAQPANARRLGLAASVGLLFIAGMGIASPFLVPTGEPWTPLLQVLATILITAPSVAAIVWLNEHLPAQKTSQLNQGDD
jgi:hypothetical protein